MGGSCNCNKKEYDAFSVTYSSENLKKEEELPKAAKKGIITNNQISNNNEDDKANKSNGRNQPHRVDSFFDEIDKTQMKESFVENGSKNPDNQDEHNNFYVENFRRPNMFTYFDVNSLGNESNVIKSCNTLEPKMNNDELLNNALEDKTIIENYTKEGKNTIKNRNFTAPK